jgi:predicted dehydrogenase
MMNDSKIRIGIVGAGAIVKQRHLPGLGKLPGVEIAVVCNRRKETAQRVAAEYGIPEVQEQWQDVVKRPDLDAIWIGTTPHLHAPITIAALEAGKHVFCQARMTTDLANARSMLETAQKHPSQVTMLCPPPNGMKHGTHFLKMLRSGAIGRPLEFHLSSRNALWADPSAPAHWRQQMELSGNNILSVGIYAEVLGRWLGQPTELCAQAQVVYPDRGGYLVRIPDQVQVLGKWPGGLMGSLEWSGVAHGEPEDLLRIEGTEGTLVHDFLTDEIFLAKRGNKTLCRVEVPAEDVRSWTVEADFIGALRHGGQPEPSFQTGVGYMKFVEAIHQSMRQRQWVDLAGL